MEVQELLQTAASPSVPNEVRAEAQLKLQAAAAEHFAPYMVMLAEILSGGQAPVDVKMLATLALKNELSAKNPRDVALKASRWADGPLSVDEKSAIKAAALKALTDGNGGIAAAASQLVAAIAAIELPRGMWPDLTVLLVSMTSADQTSNVKRGALTTIGYICESADGSNAQLEQQMNGFLTAIVQAGQKTETDEAVRLAAINALSNSLEFIRPNFAREGERNLIMTCVCEATQNTDESLQSAAFGCLGKIVYHYYEFMAPYMEQALYSLTVAGMQSPHEGVQCMAVEFWSTVSEVEFDLGAEAHEEAQPPTQQVFSFVAKALPQILPPILHLLVKEDEDVAEDEWNVSMAAGMCVELIAKVAGDAALGIAMEFVGLNVQNPQWSLREAAVMAFGSVLDGPDTDKLVAIVQGSLTPLAEMIKDPSLSVRETVAWCLGRIADLVVGAVSQPPALETLLTAAAQGLQDDPRVVTHSCWTVMNLSEQLNPVPQAQTSPLSPFYPHLLQALVQTSSRTDNEHSARTSAYEALSSLVIYAPNDTLPLVMQCSSTCDERMRQSLVMQSQVVSVDDRQNVEELQINLLGFLTNIIRRAEDQVKPVSDSIMSLLAEFLQHKFPNSLVEDDVFIAIGAIAGSIGEEFAKYVEPLSPFILAALRETELSVSTTAVGLITDITHAIGERVSPFANVFMQELSQILAHFDSVRPALVPPSLACIGDLASATGPSNQFDVFLPGTAQFLAEIGRAMQFSPEASVDQQIHVASTKEAILDAHVGIIAGYRDSPVKLQPFVQSVLEFVRGLCEDPYMMELATSSMIRNIVGLLGDLASMYPNELGPFRENWVRVLVEQALHSQDKSTRDTARYAKHECGI